MGRHRARNPDRWQRGLPADINTWRGERDRIYHQIMSRGWNDEKQAFVQHYETDVLDAGILLMPLVKFIAPDDTQWLSTLDAITGSSSPTASSTGTTSR